METDIKNYIEASMPELKGRLYPLFTTDLSRLTVAYNFTLVSGGHLKQSQLELKIIGGDYDECKGMEIGINRVMDMEEDQPFIKSGSTRFHSSVAGGGCLFNEEIQRHEDTVIYIIDWRQIDEG